MRSRSASFGKCSILNLATFLRKSSAALQISDAWRSPLSSGIPDTNMYASPIVSIWPGRTHRGKMWNASAFTNTWLLWNRETGMQKKVASWSKATEAAGRFTAAFVYFKGAVPRSQYSVIFCAFFARAKKWLLLAQVSWTSARSAARTASPPQLGRANVIFLEQLSFSRPCLVAAIIFPHTKWLPKITDYRDTAALIYFVCAHRLRKLHWVCGGNATEYSEPFTRKLRDGGSKSLGIVQVYNPKKRAAEYGCPCL